jgi:regulatory protein
LRYRDRSRRDIEERLARAGVEEASRAEALATLERLGYVDDGRFASSRAAALAARGLGDAAIEDALAREGIDGEAAAAAMRTIAGERERAAVVVEREGRNARTAARLSRRGFSHETVDELLGDVAAGEG